LGAIGEVEAAEPEPRKEVRATRVVGHIEVDGRLEEPAWARGQPVTGFTQTSPNEGEPASLETEVVVLFDDEALYVGARLHDSAPPTTRLSRRDDYVPADWFGVHLDPHHDHLSGASFYVSAAGVQRDTLRYNDVHGDTDWDAVWESAVQVDEGGWTVEIRIPFSQLRFQATEHPVWGIHFTRSINRLHEEDGWVYIPLQASGFVSWFGHLVGLEGIRPRRNLELLPYGVVRGGMSTWDRDSNPVDPVHVPYVDTLDLGLDFKYGIGPSLTLTGTINPDFGQVEVDPAVVNLSQYETFYAEKRPFFLEGSDLFDFGASGASSNWTFNLWEPQVFYSRRIGRAPHLSGSADAAYVSPEHETRILGAAKLTGKTPGGLSVATLSALTAPVYVDEVLLDGSEQSQLVEPLSNYAVGRVTQDLPDGRGKVGAMLTSVYRNLPAEGDLRTLPRTATTAGLDGFLVLGDRKWVVDTSLNGSYVEGDPAAMESLQTSSARYFQRPDADHLDLDTEATSLMGWMGNLAVNSEGGKLGVNVKATAISPGYEVNDLGYLRRSDVIYSHGLIRYDETEPGRVLRNWRLWASKYQSWNFGGDLISNGLSGNISGKLLNYWGGWVGGGARLSSWDDRLTRGGPLTVNPSGGYGYTGIYSDYRKRFFGQIGGSVSWNRDAGRSLSVFLVTRWQATDGLKIVFLPDLGWSEDAAQYVGEVDPAPTTHPPVETEVGYLFSELESWNLSLTTRVDWILSPKLSLQVYAQPMVYTGDYGILKLLAAPKTFEFVPYSTQSQDFDFNFASFRASVVLRWEFRPGSAFYAVYTSDRSNTENSAVFRGIADLGVLADAPAGDMFMLKLSYWWTP